MDARNDSPPAQLFKELMKEDTAGHPGPVEPADDGAPAGDGTPAGNGAGATLHRFRAAPQLSLQFHAMARM